MWLFKKIRKWTHVYDVYDSVSEYFVKPTLHFYISTKDWIKLPTWYIGKYNQYNWKERKWNEAFLKTCSRFGRWWRGFIKPYYILPRFFKFGIENWGLGYKSKWDEWRFEHNPVFAITIFGIRFSWVTTAPVVGEDYISNETYIDSQNEVHLWRVHSSDSEYWETMLYVRDYGFEEGLKWGSSLSIQRETGQMEENNKSVWEEIDSEGKKGKTWQEISPLYKKLQHITIAWFVSPEYIKPKYYDKWYEEYQKRKKEHPDYLWYR